MPFSLPLMRSHLIEPLNADVYGVSDESRESTSKSTTSHEAGAAFTVEDMRQAFGRHFRAGILLSHDHMLNVGAYAWPEIAASRAMNLKMFPYLYKIWWCGQLIHRTSRSLNIRYDFVVRTRPDLLILAEWSLEQLPTAAPAQPAALGSRNGATCRADRVTSDVEGEDEADRFELRVGKTCVRLGERSVVVHANTYFCANDYLAAGSLAAMTVTMDLARFVTPTAHWLSPYNGYDDWFKRSTGSEVFHSLLWWRTGTRVHRYPLFVELARDAIKLCNLSMANSKHEMERCSRVNGYAVHQLGCRTKPYPDGAFKVNSWHLQTWDCLDACLKGDHAHWTGSNPPYDVWPSVLREPPGAPHSYCADVEDLEIPNPLRACRDRLDQNISYPSIRARTARRFDKTWHGDPQIHLRVKTGYGVARIFAASDNARA